MDKNINMNIWVAELRKKDIIIGQDWLITMKSVINWKIRKLELKQQNIEEILNWLQDLLQVFEKFPDKKLLSERPEMNHEINLIQDIISPASLIPEKSQDHIIIKKYLDEILQKSWIKPSNFRMRTSIFLISKPGGKRSVVDYQKLNSVIIKDSTILSLIKDILNQI